MLTPRTSKGYNSEGNLSLIQRIWNYCWKVKSKNSGNIVFNTKEETRDEIIKGIRWRSCFNENWLVEIPGYAKTIDIQKPETVWISTVCIQVLCIYKYCVYISTVYISTVFILVLLAVKHGASDGPVYGPATGNQCRPAHFSHHSVSGRWSLTETVVLFIAFWYDSRNYIDRGDGMIDSCFIYCVLIRPP